jgi:methionine S-methyltransferase
MAAPEDVEAFLATCAASGDAAYGAAKAVLERLQAPATRAEARRLLGAVRRRFAAGGPAAGHECFRTFHFRIHDVVLDPHLQGLSLVPPPTIGADSAIWVLESRRPVGYHVPDPAPAVSNFAFCHQ